MSEIIDVIQQGGGYKLILESGSTLVTRYSSANLVGFNEDYFVVDAGDYAIVLDASGDTHAQIQLLGRAVTRVSGGSIYLRDGNYSVRYDMHGNRLGQTQHF